MQQPLLCIYHANCLDGFTAAWAVWKRFPNTEFIAGHYQEPPPDCSGREVVMVDFSYKRPELLEIAAQANSVLILDHHRSAEAELIDLPVNVIAEFDMERSGAMMAWNHYHPGEDPGWLVAHVQDRDLWRFDLEHTKAFTAFLYSQDFDFELWNEIDTDIRQGMSHYLDYVRIGQVLELKHNKDVKALIEVGATRINLAGYDVPCLNAPFIYASEAGNRLCAGEPFSVTWYDTGQHRVYSLRSDEQGVDVATIADQFGGGGHRHAAGFKLPVKTFHAQLELTEITESVV